MNWMEALKAWNGKKVGRWCIPRKGTAEYEEVRALMTGKTKKMRGGIRLPDWARRVIRHPVMPAVMALLSGTSVGAVANELTDGDPAVVGASGMLTAAGALILAEILRATRGEIDVPQTAIDDAMRRIREAGDRPVMMDNPMRRAAVPAVQAEPAQPSEHIAIEMPGGEYALAERVGRGGSLQKLADENPYLARIWGGMLSGGRQSIGEEDTAGQERKKANYALWKKGKLVEALQNVFKKVMKLSTGKKIVLRSVVQSVLDTVQKDWRAEWLSLLEDALEVQDVEMVDSLVGLGVVFSKSKKRVAPAPETSTDSTVSESKMNTKALERLGVFKPGPPTVITDTTAGAPTLDEDELEELMLIDEIGRWKFWRNDAAARRNSEKMKSANDKIKELENKLKDLRRRTSTSAYSTMKSMSVQGTPAIMGRRESQGRRVSTLENL